MTKRRTKVNWKLLWKQFNKWFAKNESTRGWLGSPGWTQQRRKIQVLVDEQLRAK